MVFNKFLRERISSWTWLNNLKWESTFYFPRNFCSLDWFFYSTGSFEETLRHRYLFLLECYSIPQVITKWGLKTFYKEMLKAFISFHRNPLKASLVTLSLQLNTNHESNKPAFVTRFLLIIIPVCPGAPKSL